MNLKELLEYCKDMYEHYQYDSRGVAYQDVVEKLEEMIKEKGERNETV